jgi:hypothetical protein
MKMELRGKKFRSVQRTVCITFSRSGWSVVRSASIAKVGTSKKRPSPHLHKAPILSNNVSPRTFQTSLLDRREWSVSLSGHFNPWRNPGPTWQEAVWGLDAVATRKIPNNCREPNPGRQACKLVTIQNVIQFVLLFWNIWINFTLEFWVI